MIKITSEKTGRTWYVPTAAELSAAMGDGGVAGWCIGCGNERHDIEPDAHQYICQDCGRRTVYGAEQIALLGLYRL